MAPLSGRAAGRGAGANGSPPWGPLAYGALFTVVLPVGLVVWARAAEAAVPLPAFRMPFVGTAIGVAGLAMCAAGMLALRRRGGGLPMNAFPPPRYVTTGVYGWVSHPIYLGFSIACAGVALAFGSAAGLWLVTPLVALGSAALVFGYERHDLRRRFGEEALRRPRIALPEPTDGAPDRWDHLSVFVLVFLPWTVAYEAVFRLGVPPDAIEGFLPFERGWPVWVWTEAVYASVYALVLAVPFVAASRRILRHFAVTGLWATLVVTLVYLTVPVVAPPRPFVAGGMLGRMLEIERAMSHTVAAFPAFHVVWTLVAAEAWVSGRPRWRAPVWGWATAIAASCVTTGMHAVADVVAAAALWLLLRRYRAVWERLRRSAERVANAWREWRVGGVRIINHGFFAGASAAVGCWVASALAGPEGRLTTWVIFGSGLLGAGLWAQRLEGSSVLSRPFGYFGSVVGATAGGLAVSALGLPVLAPLTATAVAAPWIQAIGRLRCLVQGCCHGRPAPAWLGIEYRVPNSRVLGIAGLGGRPLHPTPLYSILGNVVIGILLARLWKLGADMMLIGGLYFILAGIARFVEESYRGEPQTPVVRGLRLYQWTSIAMLLTGVVMTAVPLGGAPDSVGWLDLPTLGGALLVGGVTLVAMGVDFPESIRRYARLSG